MALEDIDDIRLCLDGLCRFIDGFLLAFAALLRFLDLLGSRLVVDESGGGSDCDGV